LLFYSCYVFKTYRFRIFELKDLDKLDAVNLPPSAQPALFNYDTANNKKLTDYLDEI
jgi:hypothetical protein